MEELIHNFGIDWKLLLAQVVNFTILLFLLKRFAYQPVLAMLRKRREEIERGVALTKEAEQAARQADELKAETLKQAHVEALAIVQKAEVAAKSRGGEIVSEAVKKSEGIVHDAKRIIGEEKARMGEEIYQNAQELIREGLTRVLGKMRPEARDQVLINEALQELKAHTSPR